MTTQEIADFLSAELVGDGNAVIERVADLASAKTGDLTFSEKSDGMSETRASCVIVPLDFIATMATSVVKAENPKLAFAKVAKEISPVEVIYGDFHPSAVYPLTDDIRAGYIGPFVSIGKNTYIGEGCQIHAGVRIGTNVTIKNFTVIHPNSVIYDNVEIGSNCVIHAGTVIGADGFGYVRDEKGAYHQFPQIGTVVIEDNVEIGANSCIDRGALGETRIGEGTKIDNQVQIGHNVQIGKRVIIAAQTGISGSTVIEDDCVIGGQVGMGDHARVLSGAVIGSQAGVLPGKIVRAGVWWGTPVQPLDEYKRQNAHVKGLSRFKEEVKALKQKLDSLENRSSEK